MRCLEVELVGFRMFIDSSTLGKLKGRRLILKSVKCSTFPDYEFLVIENEIDPLKWAKTMKMLPKIG